MRTAAQMQTQRQSWCCQTVRTAQIGSLRRIIGAGGRHRCCCGSKVLRNNLSGWQERCVCAGRHLTRDRAAASLKHITPTLNSLYILCACSRAMNDVSTSGQCKAYCTAKITCMSSTRHMHMLSSSQRLHPLAPPGHALNPCHSKFKARTITVTPQHIQPECTAKCDKCHHVYGIHSQVPQVHNTTVGSSAQAVHCHHAPQPTLALIHHLHQTVAADVCREKRWWWW
jgi:hypothetical protein